MLARPFRLRKKAEFQEGYKKGRVYRGRFAVVYYLASDQPDKRVGVVVSTKIGSAVVRSRVKRLFREAAHQFLPSLKQGARVILVARVRARETGFREIATEFERILKELGALDF